MHIQFKAEQVKSEITMKVKYVARVTQLDAIQFDSEIKRIFKNQLYAILQDFYQGVLSKFEQEFDLILNILLWKYSIHKSHSSCGQQLFSIQYDSDVLNKSKLLLHFTFTVVLRYLKEKLGFNFTSNEFLQNCIYNVESIISLANLINFMRFLKTGKCPTLAEYVLGLEHISMQGNKVPIIGYSHMTRELIWAAFVELLMLAMPFINYHTLRRKLKEFIPWTSKAKTSIQNSTQLLYSVNTLCAICNDRVRHPHFMSCRHVFCYYCLQSNILADPQFCCPLCDHHGPIQRVTPISYKGI